MATDVFTNINIDEQTNVTDERLLEFFEYLVDEGYVVPNRADRVLGSGRRILFAVRIVPSM